MNTEDLITCVLVYFLCGAGMMLNKDVPETKLEVLKLGHQHLILLMVNGESIFQLIRLIEYILILNGEIHER